MKYFFIISAIFFIAQPVRADHDLDIYSFDNLFIYDTFSKGSGLRTINIVVLDDKRTLKVSGSVRSNVDANVDAFSNYKNFLIVLLWNRLEIFDLGNPQKPYLVKTYKLEQHRSWPGFGRIIKDGNVFLLLSTKTTSKLIMDDDVNKWKMEPFERTEELHKATLIQSFFPAFDDFSNYIVKKTKDFKFEIKWKTIKTGKYFTSHKKYLAKVRKSNNALVSKILLGEIGTTGGD